MKRYVTVRLTQAEAAQVLTALDYVTEYPNSIEFFGEAFGDDDNGVVDTRGFARARHIMKKIEAARAEVPA